MKLSFLDAALHVLRESGKPLSTKDIAIICLNEELIESSGDTPWKTFNSKLSTEILSEGSNSIFMRVAEGVYGLREWKDRYPEYIAKRYVKKLYDEDIAVIACDALSRFVPGSGLFHEQKDFSDLFRSSLRSMRRSDAERSYDVVQLVSVFVVRFEDKFLTYMRSARLPESRLHGEYSIMLGGHLNIEDFDQLEMSFSFGGQSEMAEAMLIRELSEELVLDEMPRIRRFGLLYDASRDVSRQHLGLVYLVDIKSEKFEIGERGFLMNPKLETLDQIKGRRSDFENWSWMLIDNMEFLAGGR